MVEVSKDLILTKEIGEREGEMRGRMEMKIKDECTIIKEADEG